MTSKLVTTWRNSNFANAPGELWPAAMQCVCMLYASLLLAILCTSLDHKMVINLRATDVLPIAMSSVRWACKRKKNEVVTGSSRPRSLQASFACCTDTHMSIILQRAVACTCTHKSNADAINLRFAVHHSPAFIDRPTRITTAIRLRPRPRPR